MKHGENGRRSELSWIWKEMFMNLIGSKKVGDFGAWGGKFCGWIGIWIFREDC
jgi:hypothetical protein